MWSNRKTNFFFIDKLYKRLFKDRQQALQLPAIPNTSSKILREIIRLLSPLATAHSISTSEFSLLETFL